MPGPSTVNWVLYTLSFKKIAGKESVLTAPGTLTVALKDKWGEDLPNGLYYLKVTVDEAGPGGKDEKLYKIMVLR